MGVLVYHRREITEILVKGYYRLLSVCSSVQEITESSVVGVGSSGGGGSVAHRERMKRSDWAHSRLDERYGRLNIRLKTPSITIS